MKHIPDTVGLKLANPGARNLYELPVQLGSGNYTTLSVIAHSNVEALAMAKRHGYIVLRDVPMDAPAVRPGSGVAALAFGGLALVASLASRYIPELCRFFGWSF
jgi:hypothetical protein